MTDEDKDEEKLINALASATAASAVSRQAGPNSDVEGSIPEFGPGTAIVDSEKGAAAQSPRFKNELKNPRSPDMI